MHGAFNTPCWVDEAANQWATTVGATVLDGVNCSANVEEGDLDAVELHELTATRGEFVEAADLGPGFGHVRNVRRNT